MKLLKPINKIYSFTIYRKMLFSFLFFIAVTVIILSTILFSLFSSSTAKEISNTSKALLEQTSYASNFIHEQVYSLGTTLLNDNDVYTALYTEKRDAMKEFKAVSRMSTISYVYPYIKYISIYNGDAKRYITSQGVPVETGVDIDVIEKINERINQREYMYFFPRKSEFEPNQTNTVTTNNVLTFILFPNYSYLSPSKSAIVINVDESYIRSTIQGMITNKNDNIFVMDNKGTILSHTNSELFLEDFSSKVYTSRILSSTKNSGYFIQKIDGERQLVTYVKSSKLNWYFVNIKPYHAILSNILYLRNLTIIIAIIIIIVGILLSLIVSKNVYNPLKVFIEKIINSNQDSKYNSSNNGNKKYDEIKLLSEVINSSQDKVQSLQTSIETATPIFKQTYFEFLLKGNYDDVSDTIRRIQDVDKDLKSSYFFTIIIKIDNYDDFVNNISIKDQSLYRFAICNISQELVEAEFKNDAFSMKEDEVVLLIQSENNSLSESFYAILKNIQKTIKNHFDISLSISIGDIVSSKHSIHLSYESAQDYINYRLFYGHNSIIDSDKVCCHNDNNGGYPNHIEKKLVKAIDTNYKEKIFIAIDEFLSEINSINYNHAMVYTNQFVVSVSSHFQSFIDAKNKEGLDYYGVINELPKVETLNDIGVLLQSFFCKISNTLEEYKNNKNDNKIKDAEKYLLKNYNNPNISIELVAEYVNLSPGYFGKLFKAITHKFFNDYLNDVRMKEAQKLLITTDEPISTICEKVGIYNSTYFYTLFKKTYTTTPAQYRKKHKKS